MPDQPPSKKRPPRRASFTDVTDGDASVEWQVQFTGAIIEEIQSLTNAQADIHGSEFARLARFNIVTSLISNIVYEALSAAPKGATNLRAATDKHHLAYLETKQAIADAVSSGFEAAVKVWSDQTPEYYCSIQMVPEPFNKEAC